MKVKEEIELLSTNDQALVLFYLLGRYKGNKEFAKNVKHGIEYINTKKRWETKAEKDIDLDWYSDRWDILNIAGME